MNTVSERPNSVEVKLSPSLYERTAAGIFSEISTRMEEMPEPNADHFTPADRRALTELSLHVSYVREDIRRLSESVPDKSLFDEMRERQATMDGRIRVLENFRWWVLGGGLAAGATAGLALSKVIHP